MRRGGADVPMLPMTRNAVMGRAYDNEYEIDVVPQWLVYSIGESIPRRR